MKRIENIGEMIKKMRKSRGLSQTELAEILKMPQSSISTWERDHFPDWQFIIKAIEFLAPHLELWEFIRQVQKDELQKNTKLSKKELPDYVTQDDLEFIKILNQIPEKPRIFLKEMFSRMIEFCIEMLRKV